jgi:beta-glucosidase
MNAHDYLMKDVLRDRWGFDGYYVSDCWALVDFFNGHNIVETVEEAAALALKSGTNLNCGSTYQNIISSVEKGLTTEEMIDQNVRDLMGTRFRLGLFDPVGSGPFDNIGAEVIRSDEHIKLAHETAVKSIVLLKNQDNTLPLSKDLEKIFVTGPTATHMQALLANYYGVSEDMKTILEGIVGEVSPQTSVMYRQGALLDRPNVNPRDWFTGEAANSDVTIACMGISQLIEGEEGESLLSPHLGDRVDIGLPPSQLDFLKRIREKANKLVVVITAGSALSIPEVYEMADAILYVWYPGEQGGAAVADVIFGDENPSGRLPLTFVNSVEDLPPYKDYSMTGRTYRFMEKEALFPFGFGLSYTKFEYKDISFSAERVKRSESLSVSAVITNSGSSAGEEVVQLYITDLESSTRVPIQALKGFQRVNLKPGESKTVSFEITPELMEIVDDEGNRIIEKGEFKVVIAGASPSGRNEVLGASKGVSGIFRVR